MPHLSRNLQTVVAARHGVVRTDELLADGLTTNGIRRLVTSGFLVRVHRSTYRIASSPDTFESRCAAACAADNESIVSGVAAGRLWEFRHVYRTETPIVLTAHDRTPLARGVLLRRTNVLDATDSVIRRDGIRLAAPTRAWFDCARDLNDDKFECLTEWVLDRHTTMPELWATTRRLAARGRPGLARVQRVMSKRADWQKPAASGLEVRVLNALEQRGVGPLVRQHPLHLPNGVTIHPDGADPLVRWAVEIDHVTWHGGRLDSQRDKGRDRNARRVGWQIDRVTFQELSDDFDRAIDELVELYQMRCREVIAA
jgi:hypothetical protein